MWIYFGGLYSFICLFILLPMPYCFDYYSCIEYLKPGGICPPLFFFSFNIKLATLFCLFCLSIKTWELICHIHRIICWGFLWDCKGSIIKLGTTDTLTGLSLNLYEHGITIIFFFDTFCMVLIHISLNLYLNILGVIM